MKIKPTWKFSSIYLSLFTWSKFKFTKNGLICLLFLLFCIGNNYAQNGNSKNAVKVTGTVLDSKGLSLPSATVLEKGTKNAVTTDFDGTFSIMVSSPQAILVFKFIGMKETEMPVNDSKKLSVTMQDETSDLQAVVVVGYGTQKKA